MAGRLWKGLLLGLWSALTLLGADFLAYTEELPPLNYLEGARVTGYGPELLRLVCAQAGFTVKIQLLPWVRAEKSAQSEPNSILFSLARTEEREHRYQWLGPISPRHIVLIRLAARPAVNPASMDEAKRFMVGATLDSATIRQLRQLGFVEGISLDPALNDDLNFKKLLGRRVDLIAILDWAAAWQARQNGVPYASLAPVLTLDDSRDYYFGVSLSVDPAKVARLQRLLDRLRDQGRLEALQAKYLK